MWSNQENRVRKQVKNPCEVVAYAMHSSGKTSLAAWLVTFTQSSQIISTQCLTVLTKRCNVILQIEQEQKGGCLYEYK